MLNVAVFGSGRGTNFQAILQALDGGKLPGVRIVVVLSNNSDAGILHLARAHGIPSVHVSERQFGNEQEYADSLLATLKRHDATFVALAGFMKRIPKQMIVAYRNRIVNIHPALLPKFGGKGMYGLHVHEAVLAAGESVSGATVHVVDEEYDHGPIVVQRQVPVRSDDTPETLAARVLEVEHLIYPEALLLFAAGKVSFPVSSALPQ
jgi:phosphoribosylglycinamide formyltransferase-1